VVEEDRVIHPRVVVMQADPGVVAEEPILHKVLLEPALLARVITVAPVALPAVEVAVEVLAVSAAMAPPLGVVVAVSDHYIMEHIMLVVAVVASVVAVASVEVALAPL
jgi:hypothetical protein